MKIKQKKEGKDLVVTFDDLANNQLDLTSVTKLRKKFKMILGENFQHLIINFEYVDYIDSAIIGFIVDIFNTIRNKKAGLKMINVNKNVYEILELINLTKFLEITKR